LVQNLSAVDETNQHPATRIHAKRSGVTLNLVIVWKTHIRIHPARHFSSRKLQGVTVRRLFLMSYAHHPAVERVAEISAGPDRVSRRNSVFKYLLEALHESRRLQAVRAIHHYRHLLQKDRASTTGG
jgi:hypothetical protein